uniref:Uncharacterized protein n=1 Tax=mine drainage metagenome TaxID=410659 RepID=E6QK02_9ZZZZ
MGGAGSFKPEAASFSSQFISVDFSMAAKSANPRAIFSLILKMFTVR